MFYHEFYHEYWKHIYFGGQKVKGQRHEEQKNIAGVGFCTLVSADFFSSSFLLCVHIVDV